MGGIKLKSTISVADDHSSIDYILDQLQNTITAHHINCNETIVYIIHLAIIPPAFASTASSFKFRCLMSMCFRDFHKHGQSHGTIPSGRLPSKSNSKTRLKQNVCDLIDGRLGGQTFFLRLNRKVR